MGNVRTALFNWLFAKRHGGTFILRLDDTDRQRSKPEYEAAIERDLAWLGLDWARKERQADRLPHYDAARDRLIAIGRLYPCYETPEELEFKRKRLLSQGRPPVYDRAALKLGDADRARLEGEGRRPHWRFKLATEEVRWDDLVRGPQHIDEASQSDPVLVRADGSYLYSFTSVVDDIAFGITHVIRGEDHVTNSAAQIQIFRALDAEVPAFAHLPLLVDAQGGGLSKRAGSLSIADLRARDIEALAIAALLARLGTADPVEPVTSLDALVATVDFSRVGRAAARFSEDELAHLSARTIHALPYAAVRERLPATVGEPLWLAVRGNLTTLADARTWADDRRRLAGAGARGSELPRGGRGAPAARAVGRDDVEGMDGRGLGGDPAQGPGAVPSAAAGAHRARDRAGDGQAPAADRPRQGIGAAQRAAGIRIAARPSATNSSAATTRTILSGRRLAMASPNSTTGALAISMPSVVPRVTSDQRLEAGGQRHRGDLRLVADLDEEEGDQRGEEGSRLARRLRALVGLVGDQAPARHDDEGDGEHPAHRLGADPGRDLGADPGGERVVGQRGAKDAEDDRQRLAVARRQHQGQEAASCRRSRRRQRGQWRRKTLPSAGICTERTGRINCRNVAVSIPRRDLCAM